MATRRADITTTKTKNRSPSGRSAPRLNMAPEFSSYCTLTNPHRYVPTLPGSSSARARFFVTWSAATHAHAIRLVSRSFLENCTDVVPARVTTGRYLVESVSTGRADTQLMSPASLTATSVNQTFVERSALTWVSETVIGPHEV